ncbi:hypothetical protein CEXT_446841 [Caerostris extrusa]|uniref:Uncharacterized protein n=1 Tax=Caerostris extrusa TaxID=172846 RepID=A0AAV4SXL8_CAEEX|nr:hypothetical protein CEXT_446841 [Caerostris extrusa]
MGVQRRKDDEKMELKKATKNATTNCRKRGKLASDAYEDLFRHVFDIYLRRFIRCVSQRTNKERDCWETFFLFSFRIVIRIKAFD